MLIFIATKTGLSKHNVLYLPTILRLLKFPQSIGILGINLFSNLLKVSKEGKTQKDTIFWASKAAHYFI